MVVETEYNYAAFPPGTDRDDFVAFPERVKVGHPSPDGELTLLDGGLVRLSDLWREGTLVLEFRALT